jgi:hypothetical protein
MLLPAKGWRIEVNHCTSVPVQARAELTGDYMDFHIITSDRRVHLFSTEKGLVVDAPCSTIGATQVEPTHESRSPLTTVELKQIENASSDPTVGTLHLEIARLRSVVQYADLLQPMLANLTGPHGSILNAQREKLKEEPCLAESSGMRDALSG